MFFDTYNDDFFEYFGKYKVLKVMQNKEYKKINQQICSVKEKYPKVISLLEDNETVALNYEEGKAINKILKLKEELDGIEIKEAFKLEFKEDNFIFKPKSNNPINSEYLRKHCQ